MKQPSKALLFHSQDARRAKDNARHSLGNLAEANRELGRVLERERIIALLERSCLDHDIYENPCGSFCEAVALIKGKQK